MRKELKPYADEAYGIVTTAANDIGSRLPGSEGEKKFADLMESKLGQIGVKPVKEKFIVSPRASIGGIPYAGWVGIVGAVLMFVPYFYGLVFFACLATWVWLVASVFLYRTWFDPCFRQEPSQNVYGEVLPKNGNYKYTVILSAHLDTSWNWKHSLSVKKNPAPAFIKMGIGIVAFLFLTVMSLAMFILFCEYEVCSNASTSGAYIRLAEVMTVLSQMRIAVYVLMPLFVIPGCFMVTMWADKNGRTASPGAMDNATGIGIAYAATKYFVDNPDALPEGCRIINANFGSEEAGLRGSIAFTKKHKDDDLLGDRCYNINIDSIADEGYYSAINGDVWQFTKFDKGLENILAESIEEVTGQKAIRMQNPVGGCDSTPMTKAGIKSITFAAQNPTLTNYYHTFNDVAERFSVDTVHTGLDIVLRCVDKIAAAENSVAVKAEQPAAAPVQQPAQAPVAEQEVQLQEVQLEEVGLEEDKD